MTACCSISAPASTAACAAWPPPPTRCWSWYPTSLTDAYAVLKLHALDRPQSVWEEGHVRVVINQATSQVSGERTYATLARACEAFIRRRPDLAGIIRRDDHVRDAVRRQTPLLTRHPSCVAARDVERVAASLV